MLTNREWVLSWYRGYGIYCKNILDLEPLKTICLHIEDSAPSQTAGSLWRKPLTTVPYNSTFGTPN